MHCIPTFASYDDVQYGVVALCHRRSLTIRICMGKQVPERSWTYRHRRRWGEHAPTRRSICDATIHDDEFEAMAKIWR